jgi:hypothetical protein
MGGPAGSNQFINCVLSVPRGPSSAVNAAATTIAGSTKGMVVSARRMFLAGKR